MNSARLAGLTLVSVLLAVVPAPRTSRAHPVLEGAAAGVAEPQGFVALVSKDGPQDPVRYVVQAGDNLYAIARRFGTTSKAIAALNGLPNRNAIVPGQEIVVLGVGPAKPPPLPPPTAAVIAQGPAVPVVAFSFDAGSDVGYTALILDVLRANGITASFGMTGAWAAKNPDMLRRIVAEGHHLINHSYSHPDFRTLSTAARWDELDRAEGAVVAATGLGMKPYFRPPYGGRDATVDIDLAARGYYFDVMWTVDSLGWTGLTAGQIVERCLSRAGPGAVFLFHVGSQSEDGPALQTMIDGFRQRGYQVVSVADLLGH